MPLLVVFFLLSLSSLPPLSSSNSLVLIKKESNPPAIGVAYRPHLLPSLPSSDRVASALHSAGVSRLLLDDPDPTTLRSFLYTDISLLLLLPHNLTSSSSRDYLSSHVLPFHPRIRISALALPRYLTTNLSGDLLSACSALGLPRFPISPIHPFSVLSPAFPPSAARFTANITKPYLDLLAAAGSPFLIDLSPFDLYRSEETVPIGFAMFEEGEFGYRDDPATGLRYRNLFDMMVDAVVAALARAGHRRMAVVVTGTGWPSEGAKGATADYARMYNQGLVRHLRMGLGTPMRRDGVAAVYVRELFDDLGMRAGLEFERHWGIWYRNLSAKYELDFSGAAGGGGGGGAAAAMAVAVLVAVMMVLVAEV